MPNFQIHFATPAELAGPSIAARSAVFAPGSAKMCSMKRSQRWSLDSEEGPGHRRSQAGPFRRRRALRHLDSLAQHPARELSETVGVAHVRVIGDSEGQPSPLRNGVLPAPVPVSLPAPTPVPTPTPTPTAAAAAAILEQRNETPRLDVERARNASDRFHAEPTDEELGVLLLPATQQR